MTPVFVYGTLKRGHCNAHLLESGLRPNARGKTAYVGLARTQPCYRMYNCVGYPGLVPSPHEGISIEGEVWEVDAVVLERLHALEGVEEGLYAFEPVQLATPSSAAVFAYFYLGETQHLLLTEPSWPKELDYGRKRVK